jgi:hypothetical protein
VDGSCLGSLFRCRFGGIIRNTFGHYLAGFIQGSSNILLAEVYVIYKSLFLANDMNIDELVYSDFLHCVNFIKGPQVRYHIHIVLIQSIMLLFSQTNVSLYHTLRQKNQYSDFFAKLGASSDAGFLTHVSHSGGVHDPLKNDAIKGNFISP